jgi:uncharacterized SAM-binding protein YcdF (DUF218 family)
MNSTLTPVIVVPDGLAADESGRGTSRPSFVFRAVLDAVGRLYAEHEIFVAPANDFGGPVPEEEAGRLYLLQMGCKHVQVPDRRAGGAGGYIDTRGNAALLRKWLEGQGLWPLGPSVLVSAALHSRRATLCFSAEGFRISKVERISYRLEREPIVPRLFYYRHPLLHWLYESVALMRDRVRIALERNRQTS